MRPALCESCAAGKHRAYCATFPRPCEDLIDIWDESREATIRECAAEILAVAKALRELGSPTASTYLAAAKILEVKFLPAVEPPTSPAAEPRCQRCGDCGFSAPGEVCECAPAEPEEPGHE